ncbi:MAG: IclR family transcriptional regulator [Actinomycetota bacterium]|nr:IclR family transcriptional regulator [Actinomycetota bacterium]
MGHPGGTPARADATVQSVERAVSVLQILAREREAGPTEIAAELGVHKSTVSRVLAVLDRRGLATQVRERGPYRLGPGLAELAASAVPPPSELARASTPVCEWLAAASGETAGVSVLDGRDALRVVDVRSGAAVVSQHPVGQRSPAHATSVGKVLLAHLSAARRREVLAVPLTRFTASTVTEVRALAVELEEVVGRGWATSRDEWEVGLHAVAAPLRGRDGAVVGALGVSGPSFRLGPDEMAQAAALVCKAAREVGSLLGYVASP